MLKGFNATRLSFALVRTPAVAVVTQGSFGKDQSSFVSTVPLRPLLETQGWPDPPQFLDSHFHAYHDWISDERKRPVNVDIVVRPSGVWQVGVLSRVADASHSHTTTHSQGRRAWRCDQIGDVPGSHSVSLQFFHNHHWQPCLMSCAIR